MEDVLLAVAARWRDPGYEPRAEAVAATLEAPNRFTDEAVAFAVNQRMAAVTPDALAAWLGDAPAPDAPAPDGDGVPSAPTVVVRHDGTEPLAGWRSALAAWATGRPYAGVLDAASPHLLPAFAADVAAADPAFAACFPADLEAALEAAGAAAVLLAAATDAADHAALVAACAGAGVPPARRRLRPPRLAVAVLDGSEPEAVRDDLAEDVLLYDGQSRRSVRLVWAPAGTAPDALLDALATFRGAVPAHPDTPGTLRMQQAFLEARGASHAYGDGLAFLVSRGAPEPPPAGHLRWSAYDTLADVGAWLAGEATPDALAVVARPALHARLRPHLPPGVPLVPPGHLHRRPLADPLERPDPVAFLRGVDA